MSITQHSPSYWSFFNLRILQYLHFSFHLNSWIQNKVLHVFSGEITQITSQDIYNDKVYWINLWTMYLLLMWTKLIFKLLSLFPACSSDFSSSLSSPGDIVNKGNCDIPFEGSLKLSAPWMTELLRAVGSTCINAVIFIAYLCTIWHTYIHRFFFFFSNDVLFRLSHYSSISWPTKYM